MPNEPKKPEAVPQADVAAEREIAERAQAISNSLTLRRKKRIIHPPSSSNCAVLFGQ